MPKRTEWKTRKSSCLENATPYQNLPNILKEFNQEYVARKEWSLCSTRQEQIVRECLPAKLAETISSSREYFSKEHPSTSITNAEHQLMEEIVKMSCIELVLSSVYFILFKHQDPAWLTYYLQLDAVWEL